MGVVQHFSNCLPPPTLEQEVSSYCPPELVYSQVVLLLNCFNHFETNDQKKKKINFPGDIRDPEAKLERIFKIT